MEGLWLSSYVALWFCVVLEGMVLLALARQIGLLHDRLGPTGARTMNPGPKIGDLAPPFEKTDIFGRQVTLGMARGKRTLLVFLSTQCTVCQDILPGLKAISREEGDNLEIVLVSSEANNEAAVEFVKEHSLVPFPFVVSNELAASYQVAITPYAIIVDRLGKVRAKGLVNNLAHLESLLNAEEMGHHSLQSFLQEHGLNSERQTLIQVE